MRIVWWTIVLVGGAFWTSFWLLFLDSGTSLEVGEHPLRAAAFALLFIAGTGMQFAFIAATWKLR